MARKIVISDREITIFESNLEVIKKIVMLHVAKWKMGALPYMDKEDITRMMEVHILHKLHLYNENRPLGQWLSTVCSNFMKNKLRDFFYRSAPPCLGCAAFLGGDARNSMGDCSIYGKTCTECPLFNKWVKERKIQHDVNLPVTLENHAQQVSDQPFEDDNILNRIEELKVKLKDKLTKNEFHIFNALYLDNKTELDVLKELKFSSKADCLRQCRELKNKIYDVVKFILINEDLI